MKAWLLDNFTGLDALRLADVPDPTPGPGEVVLDLLFAALNPADRYLAEAQYPAKPPLPHVLGRDGVGRVSQLGPGVDTLQIGDTRAILRGDVGVTRWGTFAQKVAVPVDSVIPVPQGWSLEQASCASLVYLTAYQALTQWGDEPPQEKVVLVTGASGGVGVATVQLAKAMGHRVVALSRSPQKGITLTQLGAELVLDPNDPTWRKQLKDTLDRRVNLAVDNIGGKLFSQVVESLDQNGRVSVVGRLAGPVPEFNTASLFFRRARIGGVAVGTYGPIDGRKAWDQLVPLLDQTNQRPLVDSVWDLPQLKDAFARLAQGPMGKVLLRAGG
jgi:NADPH2:quinone reductase